MCLIIDKCALHTVQFCVKFGNIDFFLSGEQPENHDGESSCRVMIRPSHDFTRPLDFL